MRLKEKLLEKWYVFDGMFTKWPSFQCQTEFGVWRESEGLRKKVEKELEEYLKSYREKFLLYLDTD